MVTTFVQIKRMKIVFKKCLNNFFRKIIFWPIFRYGKLHVRNIYTNTSSHMFKSVIFPGLTLN